MFLYTVDYTGDVTTTPVESKLAALGITLPELPPLTTVDPHRCTISVHGNLGFVSGVGPIGVKGTVGIDLTVEEGYEAARLAGLYMLRRIRDVLDELDRIDRWLRVVGYVRSAPDFDRQPDVLNGFSDLIIEVFGERGRSARAAIGTNALPLQMPVEVEAVVALAPGANGVDMALGSGVAEPAEHLPRTGDIL